MLRKPKSPTSGGIRFAALLLLLPLVQLALDRRWLFDTTGRDPWIYYGYSRFARIYLAEAGSQYYASRLAAFMPGYVLHRLLPAVSANVVLHLGLYACALAAFYLSARLYAGRRAALLASLVLGGQRAFLSSIGSNYVDGFGITYFLVALAGLTCAADRAERAARAARADGAKGAASRPAAEWPLAVTGAGAVGLVSANLFYAIYLPLLAAHFLALRRRCPAEAGGAPPRLRWWPSIAWAAAGAGLALGVCEAVSWPWAHGPRFFLTPTLVWLLSFSRRLSIFKRAAADWLPGASWLVLPAVVLGGALVTIASRAARAASAMLATPLAAGTSRRGEPPWWSGSGFPQLQYVAFCAAMAAVQLRPQGITLQEPYYAFLLVPPACLALAGQLAPWVNGLKPRAFAALAAALCALLAVASTTRPLRLLARVVGVRDVGLVPAILAAALVVLAVVALAAAREGRSEGAAGRGAPAVAMVAAVLLCLIAVEALTATIDPRFSRDDRPADASSDRVGLLRQVDGTLSLLRAADPSLNLNLWYDRGEPAGPFYDSLASAWRLCRRLVSERFPATSGGAMCGSRPLQAGVRIAVLSQRPPAAARAAAESSLAASGLRARWLASTPLPAGPVRDVSVEVFDVAAGAATDPTQGLVPESNRP